MVVAGAQRVGGATGGVEGSHQDQHCRFRQRVTGNERGGDLDGFAGRTRVDGGGRVRPLDAVAERVERHCPRRQRSRRRRTRRGPRPATAIELRPASASLGRVRAARPSPAAHGRGRRRCRLPLVEAQTVGAAQPLEQRRRRARGGGAAVTRGSATWRGPSPALPRATARRRGRGRHGTALGHGEQREQGAPLRAGHLHDLVTDGQAQRAEQVHPHRRRLRSGRRPHSHRSSSLWRRRSSAVQGPRRRWPHDTHDTATP